MITYVVSYNYYSDCAKKTYFQEFTNFEKAFKFFINLKTSEKTFFRSWNFKRFLK